MDSFGGVDILVNNATAGAMNDLWKFTEEQWNRTVGVNVSGYFAMIRAVAPYMCRKGSGAIVNTSSGSGFGHPAMIAYSTAKEGVIGLTRTTAKEIGRFGVRCNAIRPFATGVSTAEYAKDAGSWMRVMTLTMGPEPGVESQPDFDPEQFPARKISPLVVWLCTDAAANINGRTFHVGGDEVSLLSEPAPERTVDPNRRMGPRRPRRQRARRRSDQPLHPGFVPRAEAVRRVTTPTDGRYPKEGQQRQGQLAPSRSGGNAMTDNAVVVTTAGRVRGSTVQAGKSGGTISVFRGVPYAAPPLGALRFRAPQARAPWSGIREATQAAPSPMQSTNSPFSGVIPGNLVGSVSEDCLTVDIWSPAAPGENLPVLVWVYGGAYLTGGSTLVTYDGSTLAADHGVVVVSVNYRLGAMGFLWLDDERAEANCGLRDQLAGLQWVRDNVAAFGGDPSNVTVFGESAGAGSLLHLVTAPGAADVVRRCILQSPGVDHTLRPDDASRVTDIFLRTSAWTGERWNGCGSCRQRPSSMPRKRRCWKRSSPSAPCPFTPSSRGIF